MKSVSELPVMKSHCKSCPFRLDEKGIFVMPSIANDVISRTLFQGQQICHSTNINRCKGSYDYNMAIYKRMNLDHLIK